MRNNYFDRVRALTPTKFWVNNVTREEARLGIEAGTSGCTQNPSYTWKMLSHPTEGAYARQLLSEALRESTDDNEVECILQRKLIKGISDIFMPLWKESHGKYGYVSIQGDPIHEDNPQVILDEARKNRVMNPNVMIKIPATKAGLQAMEILIEENTPINATEVMTVQQTIEICEMYMKISKKTGKKPVVYYSLITGIYNEWLRKDVAAKKVDINPDVLYQAGMVIAKKVYNLVHDRGYELGFIGGGVRTPDDFYQMVGGDVNITMNWLGAGSCQQLIEADGRVESRLFNPPQEQVIDELNAKLPQFREAYWENGLTTEDFEKNGAVEYFRDMFVDSWNKSLVVIAEERKKLK